MNPAGFLFRTEEGMILANYVVDVFRDLGITGSMPSLIDLSQLVGLRFSYVALLKRVSENREQYSAIHNK